ncbi:hypothetical protein B8W73_01120 [Arthrobacter agilis]|nr:hypothetical protein B8W73_01120 [Arthrobacter agilis]
MSETRFFGIFPSFVFKALAKILGRGFQLHTSKTYATDPAGLDQNYLRTTRRQYVQALGLRAGITQGHSDYAWWAGQGSRRSSRRLTPSFAKIR